MTSAAPLPIDSDVRQQALDVTRSYAVAAPAGSGKTGLLTLRLLKLLCRCDSPEDILCITFTRKAAAEMRERLLDALAEAEESLPEDAGDHQRNTRRLARQVLQRDRDRQWHLQAAPGRLRIQTIDSFCRSLASQLPIASALGAELGTLEDPSRAYRQAVTQLLDQYAGQAQADPDLERLIGHLDNDLNRLESLLVGLLANRDQWLGLVFALRGGDREPLEAALRDWAQELVDKARRDLGAVSGELLDCIGYATRNLAESKPDHELLALADLDTLPGASDREIQLYWQPLVNLLITGAGTWRRRLDKNCGFPPGAGKDGKAAAKAAKERFADLLADMNQRPGLLETLTELHEFPGSQYSEQEWQLLQSLTAVLPHLVAQLKLVFRQLGATDFAEVTEAALTALGGPDEPTDLALKLDYRIQHILVDEFQDTATPQLRLLEKLTEGWQADDGRTLFVVGDGMQSCYGFRDANVGIFLDMRVHGLPSVKPQALDLCVNFRSRAGIIDWVNEVFERAFPSEDHIGRGAVCYSPSSTPAPQPIEDCVTCVAFDSENGREQEADYIAAEIAQLRKRNADETIAVLVRGRAHLQDIVPALLKQGVSYRAVDIDPLLSRMPITDLLSLTRALLDPSDRIAWLSILRAPWCGLSMADLHALITTDLGDLNPAPRDRGFADIPGQISQFEAVPGLSAHGTRALARLREQMVLSWQERRRKPLRQWIEGTWLALGGPASTRSANARADVQTFFRLLEQHEKAGTIADRQEFEAALYRLYAEPLPAEDNPVELMTIHKSKGLEFDHVFLPGLDRTTRGDDSPLIVWHQRLNQAGDKQLIMSPITAAEEEQKAPLYQFLTRERKIRNELEATRLLYVACTRARQRLWLTAGVKLDDAGVPKAPAQSCLLARIWPHIEDQVTVMPALNEAGRQSQTTDADSRIRRLIEDWQLPPLSCDAPLAHLRGHEYDNTDGELADNPFSNRLARHTGTLWHRLFRRLALDGLDHWKHERVELQKPFWLIQALQTGLDRQSAEALVASIAHTLERLQSDQQAHWVFSPDHPDSQCEYPLISRDARQKLIVDRTFVDQGTRWIIDYKTSEPATGQSLDDFLAQEQSVYRQQLEGYAHAFAQMETLPQKMALYFPLLGKLSNL